MTISKRRLKKQLTFQMGKLELQEGDTLVIIGGVEPTESFATYLRANFPKLKNVLILPEGSQIGVVR